MIAWISLLWVWYQARVLAVAPRRMSSVLQVCSKWQTKYLIHCTPSESSQPPCTSSITSCFQEGAHEVWAVRAAGQAGSHGVSVAFRAFVWSHILLMLVFCTLLDFVGFLFVFFLNKGLIFFVSKHYSADSAAPAYWLLTSFLFPCQQCICLDSHLFPFLPHHSLSMIFFSQCSLPSISVYVGNPVALPSRLL